MVALPKTSIEAAWAPLGHLRVLRDAARSSVHPASYDKVRTLESLVELLEGEVREAFRAARPEDVEAVATSLGARHWKLWGHGLGMARELVADIGMDVPQAAVLGWTRLARDAHHVLPALGSAARKYVRAAVFLALELGERPGAGASAFPSDPILLFSADPPPEPFPKVFGLLHGILVSGTSGAFGSDCSEAIGHALWRTIRDASPEELHEDAWDKATMSEALLDDEASLAWDEVKAAMAHEQ
jgi:hypothetical protein